jgi:hypothetical protein
MCVVKMGIEDSMMQCRKRKNAQNKAAFIDRRKDTKAKQ